MLKPGDRVGEWTIDKQLGAGGMGTVYLAHDANETRVAVKELRAEGVPDAIRRFVREAKILAELDHPGVVKFLGFTEQSPECLIMEFAKGEPLDAWIQKGAIPTPTALGMTRQVADALAYIHSKGVWHRDIKPQNILMDTDGTSKLVDFGVAVASDRTRYTQAGSLLGTLPYVPPEALAGKEPDPVRWDVYALGVVLFEALSGKLAFRGGDGSRTGFEARLIHEKMNLKHLDPGPLISEQVRDLVRQMTDADPNRRLSNPADVSRRIQNLLQAAERASGPIQLEPKKSSNALIYGLLAAAAMGFLALVAVVGAGMYIYRPSETVAEAPPAATNTLVPVTAPVATAETPPPPADVPPATPPAPTADVPAANATAPTPTADVPLPAPADPSADAAAAQLASLRAEVKASQKRLSSTLAPFTVRFVEQSGPVWDIVVDGSSQDWATASESVEVTAGAIMAAIGTESASTHWKSRTLILKVDGKQTTTLPVSDARNFVKTGFSASQRAAMQKAIRE